MTVSAKIYGGAESRQLPRKTLMYPGYRSEREHQYAPAGLLALDPKAFGVFFCEREAESAPEMSDAGLVILNIRGPLMHHRSFFFDSYDEIKRRFAAALDLNPRAILLSIDSPGGLVAGAFDTARELRIMAQAKDVRLLAHIGGVGASAGYALATSAEWIGASETAMVGSVGVLDALEDATAQNEMFGIKVKLISSGQRKTDGHPDNEITEGAIKATQDRVDELAGMFFQLVVDHGYGGTVESLGQLQAGVFTGREAVMRSLITGVATLDDAIAFGDPLNATLANAAANKGNEMSTALEDAINALRKAAEGDDEDAERARSALRDLEEDEDEDAQGDDEDDEDAQGDEDDEDAADHGTGDKDDERSQGDEDDDDEDASASGKGADANAKGGTDALAIALATQADLHNLRAEQKSRARKRKRERLIASRDDLGADMVALMRLPSTSIATVKRLVNTLKRGKPIKRTAQSMAASDRVQGTRGQAGGDHTVSRLPADEKAALDAAMGLTETTKAVKHVGNRMIFGATLPKERS